MRLAAEYYGPTNRYGTISLASAASQAGLNWSGRAHSAVADAVMTARVVIDVTGYWSQLQREMNDVSLVKSVTAFDSIFKFNIIKSIVWAVFKGPLCG
ncbi:hypothetical protein HVH02_004309 [Salmonella enterica]|nr:hypothetical protein [Salmonella enterica]